MSFIKFSVQYSTVQYCTVLYSTVLYSVQYCTVLHSTVQYCNLLRLSWSTVDQLNEAHQLSLCWCLWIQPWDLSRIFSENCISQLPSFFDRFWCQLDSILLLKSTKILSKIDPKRHQKNDRFLNRFFLVFLSILVRNLPSILDRFWCQLGSLLLLKSTKILSKIDPKMFEAGWSLLGRQVGWLLPASWRFLGPLGRTSLHWMGWWGYAKRQDFH